jgi:hypothetical protein
MRASGALFGRADVARLLNIPEWMLANFADRRRYRYGLAPSVSGGKGRGKKSLYTMPDVYKIALAYRLVLADQDSDMIGQVVKELFPEGRDPMQIAVKQRAQNEAEARCLVVDLSHVSTFFGDLPDGSISVTAEEWQSGNRSGNRPKFTLRSRKEIVAEIATGSLRAFLVIPFDELLNWVDSRILGRKVTFARPSTLEGGN